MKTNIEMAGDAGFKIIDNMIFVDGWEINPYMQRFAALVRADERRRITNLMLYMHNQAAPMHNYYKHAAVEINRKNGEGEKI